MDSVLNLSVILSIVGVLVVLTNIITQVLKKLTWEKMPTNILVVIISMTLTLVAFFAYCQINAIVITWYMIVAAVILGFLVAYSAMFGFDKLKEVLNQIETRR
jgi:purine-cytosine permease-like protein